MTSHTRKLVAVRIYPSLIESWLKTTGDECVFHSIKGVPEDATMLDLRYNFEEGVYQVIFGHDSFEAVTEGDRIPIFTPIITTYYT